MDARGWPRTAARDAPRGRDPCWSLPAQGPSRVERQTQGTGRMTTAYSEELVHIATADGVALAGAIIRPTDRPVQPLPILWVHGYTGCFYEPHTLAIGRHLAARGYLFVTGNNRGHDYGAVLQVGATHEERLGGGAWEQLDEAPLDIAAWISYTVQLGFTHVVLVGHSLGGMKVIYYMATQQDPRVAALVNASGPVWPWPAGEVALARQAEAARLVGAGHGRDLLSWLPERELATVSAQTLVGRRPCRAVLLGQTGHPPAVALLSCPVFVVLGAEEPWIGGRADLAWFTATATAAPRCETCYITGADHFYTGCEREVADAIADWVATVP